MKKALSKRFPILLPIIWRIKIVLRYFENMKTKVGKLEKKEELLPFTIYNHQSPLKRKNSIYSPELLEAKKTNLTLGTKALNKCIIKPGETFSFWENVGYPSYRKGFKDGLMLKQGKPVKGAGGGLCQLSNLLFWMMNHTDLKLVERHHHSFDSFPDDGRTMPFGSGASVLYNYYDLRFQNNTNYTFQIETWLTENKLRGKILCDTDLKSYKVIEKDHLFLVKSDSIFRKNKIVKVLNDGTEEFICENYAPVLYEVDIKDYESRGYKFIFEK